MLREREILQRTLDVSKFSGNFFRDFFHHRRGRNQPTQKEVILSEIDRNQLPDYLKREPPPLSKEAIERWINFPRYKIPYKAGTGKDGNPYGSGEILYVGPYQVMGDFEKPWCEALSDEMFNGKRGPLAIFEAGFGMGKLSEYNLEKLKKRRGGKYYIVELNKQIYNEDLVPWAQKQELINNNPEMPHIEIIPIHGEAGEVLRRKELKGVYFDLMFFDTFYLQENHKGINDLISLDDSVSHLKLGGKYGFCPSHEGNQIASIDPYQYALLSKHFGSYSTRIVKVIGPKECTYMQGLRYLPAAAFRKLRRKI